MKTPLLLISLISLQPLFTTWWAYALCGLLLLALFGTYRKFRESRLLFNRKGIIVLAGTHHLQDPDNEKPQFFDKFNHGFRTPPTRLDAQPDRLSGQPELANAGLQNIACIVKDTNHVLDSNNQMPDFAEINFVNTPEVSFSIRPRTGLSASISDSETEVPLLLLVEDNEELRQFFTESLREKWRVLTASNGSEAMAVIFEEIPDMIISDAVMPGMDGYQLCKKVKSDEPTNHIPILLLTPGSAQSWPEGLAACADDYLAKPFHLNQLEQTIRTRLSQRDSIKEHLKLKILPQLPPTSTEQGIDPFVHNLYAQLDQLIGTSDLDVKILAATVNMSSRTLARKLKALLNISPVELIRRYRLQKAAILLAQGGTATQVCYQIGFESPSYFSQCFKLQYGVSPSEFYQATL